MKLFRAALLKRYFDEGYGFTNYFKFLIAFYGMASLNVKNTLIMGVAYGLSCFFIGWLIFWSGFKKASIEVDNRVNPFVNEMREKFK